MSNSCRLGFIGFSIKSSTYILATRVVRPIKQKTQSLLATRPPWGVTASSL